MTLLKAKCNERQKQTTRMKKKKELKWSISQVKVSSGNKLQGKMQFKKKKNTNDYFEKEITKLSPFSEKEENTI